MNVQKCSVASWIEELRNCAHKMCKEMQSFIQIPSNSDRCMYFIIIFCRIVRSDFVFGVENRTHNAREKSPSSAENLSFIIISRFTEWIVKMSHLIHIRYIRFGRRVAECVRHINAWYWGSERMNRWIHFIVGNVQVSHAIGRCIAVGRRSVHSHILNLSNGL